VNAAMSDDARAILVRAFGSLGPRPGAAAMDRIVQRLRRADDPELRALLSDDARADEVVAIAAGEGCGAVTALDLRVAYKHGIQSLQEYGPPLRIQMLARSVRASRPETATRFQRGADAQSSLTPT
jgi:hypothetical protein